MLTWWSQGMAIAIHGKGCHCCHSSEEGCAQCGVDCDDTSIAALLWHAPNSPQAIHGVGWGTLQARKAATILQST